MKHWQFLLAKSLAVAIAMAPSYAHAEVATVASIRELLTVSRSEESIKLGIKEILPALRQMAKDVNRPGF
jgi:hypothetical protein